MKLLIATPEYINTGGGIATYYRELAAGFVSLGVEVEVIEGSAFALGDGSCETHNGVKVHSLDRSLYEQYLNRFEHLSAVPRLSRHLAASWAMAEQIEFGRSYDMIEATDWGLLFASFVVSGKAPVNVQCHASIGQIGVYDPIAGAETETSFIQLLESQLLTECLAVQTCSQQNAIFWTQEIRRPVAMQYPAFQSRPIENLTLNQNGLVVGRFQRWKGPHVLAEALSQLNSKAPEISWVGRDIPWGETSQMTSDYVKAEYPKIFGSKLNLVDPLPPASIRRLQESARFNLVPSTWDVFNFTAVEAMDSGRPTIISRGAGASELVQDGKNGFLFDPDEASSLTEAILRVQSLDEAECRVIGQAARETIKQKLNPSTICKLRLEHYHELTTESASVSGWASQIATPKMGTKSGNSLNFLDEFPLRSLLNYTKNRAFRKIRNKSGRR